MGGRDKNSERRARDRAEERARRELELQRQAYAEQRAAAKARNDLMMISMGYKRIPGEPSAFHGGPSIQAFGKVPEGGTRVTRGWYKPALTAAEQRAIDLKKSQTLRALARQEDLRKIETLQAQRTLAALKGELPVSPALQNFWDTKEKKLRSELATRLGPGYASTSAGSQALSQFAQARGAALEQASRGEITAGLGAAGQFQNLALANRQLIGKLGLGRQELSLRGLSGLNTPGAAGLPSIDFPAIGGNESRQGSAIGGGLGALIGGAIGSFGGPGGTMGGAGAGYTIGSGLGSYFN